MDAYRLAAERSRALHEGVAQRLTEEPERLAEAQARVEAWAKAGSIAELYVLAWRDLLSLPLPQLVARISEDSERMHELRQVSPFAGVLAPRERWRILREVRARHDTSAKP